MFETQEEQCVLHIHLIFLIINECYVSFSSRRFVEKKNKIKLHFFYGSSLLEHQETTQNIAE